MKDLIELTLELVEAQKTIASQKQTIEEQQARIKELEEKLAAAQRAEKRQATPFAKSQEKRVKNPKPPGRKPQQGQFRHRTKPHKVDVTQKALLHQCPICHSTDLKNFHTHENFQIDIPDIKPLITRFITQSAECQKCRCPVQSRHPQQLSLATGAASVCMGPKILALAADMHEHMGCSYEKIADCFTHIFDFPVTRSALCQALDRLLKKAEPVYQQLLDIIRQASVVHADETGWKVGTLNAWLWVFTNSELTLYTIRSGEGARGHQVVLDILGKAFGGVLVSDCFNVYDVEAMQNWIKQKCIAHLLKDLKNMRESGKTTILSFSIEISNLLKKAIDLKTKKSSTPDTKYTQETKQIEKELDQLLEQYSSLTDEDAVRFLNRLNKQRRHLLTFLYHDDVEPTNNQAERMLRPEVITRKTQRCNKTDAGARKHAVLGSILATLRQRKLPVLDFLEQLQSPFASPPVIPSGPT